jgi:hypothetical protein
MTIPAHPPNRVAIPVWCRCKVVHPRLRGTLLYIPASPHRRLEARRVLVIHLFRPLNLLAVVAANPVVDHRHVGGVYLCDTVCRLFSTQLIDTLARSDQKHASQLHTFFAGGHVFEFPEVQKVLVVHGEILTLQLQPLVLFASQAEKTGSYAPLPNPGLELFPRLSVDVGAAQDPAHGVERSVVIEASTRCFEVVLEVLNHPELFVLVGVYIDTVGLIAARAQAFFVGMGWSDGDLARPAYSALLSHPCC